MYTELYKTKEEAYRREREVKALKSRVKIEILPKDFLLVRLLNAEMSDPSASSGKTTQAMSRELKAGQQTSTLPKIVRIFSRCN